MTKTIKHRSTTESLYYERARALMGERRFVLENRKIIEELPECVGYFNARYGSLVVLRKNVHRRIQRYLEGREIRFDALKPLEGKFGSQFYELIVFLLKEKMLRDTSDDEGKEYVRSVQKTLERDIRRCAVKSFYLFLTYDCNMNCSYCFVRQALTRRQLINKQMSQELFRKIARFIAQKSILDAEEKNVIFFGGEPLLRIDMIEKAAMWFTKHGNTSRFGWNPPHLGLVTNGVLVDERVVDILQCYNIEVGMSLDSMIDEVSARTRPSKTSGGYAKKLQHSIRLLDRIRLLKSVDIAVTNENIESIPALLRYIRSISDVENVKLNHLHRINPRVDKLIPDFGSSVDRLNDIYNTADELKFRLIGDCYPVYYALTAGNGRLFSSCGANGNIMCIDPDGYAFPCVRMCSEPSQKVKFRDGLNVLSSKVFSTWSRRSPWSVNRCWQYCDIFSVCGGKCMANVLYQQKRIDTVDEKECELNRYFFRRALRTRIREIWMGLV